MRLERGREQVWEQKRALSHHQCVIGEITNFQVFLQPFILLEEELLAKFKVEINFSGKGDDVC